MRAFGVVHLLTQDSTVLLCLVAVFKAVFQAVIKDVCHALEAAKCVGVRTWPRQLGSSYPGWLSGRRLPGLAQA